MRNMKKPLMIAMAAFALAAAGCASSEDESFKQDFNAAQAPLEKLITDTGTLRHPVYKGLRDDLEPADVIAPEEP